MRLPLFAMFASTILSSAALAQTAATDADDPYIWLEEKDSARALAWVEAHNAVSTAKLEADPRYATLFEEALAIAGAKDRIAAPAFRHGEIYNFWQDPEHLRGIWRKTSLADYRTAEPTWTTVIDVDALNQAEGKSFVWKGAACLPPEEKRCLISLSEGGEDAVEVREFDLDTGQFVADGFNLPKGKQDVTWEDLNHVLVAAEWAPGDVTGSGYPFIVKRLTRGKPIASGVELFRGDKADGGYGVSPYVARDGEGRTLTVISRPLDTFRAESYVVTPRGVERLAIPLKASVQDLVSGRVIVKLDEAWTVGGTEYPAGALVDLDLAAVKARPGALKPSLVWKASPRDSLEAVTSSKNRLLLATLDNVRGRLWSLRYDPRAGWTSTKLDLPDNLALGYGSSDDKSDLAFLNSAGFIAPNALYLADAASGTVEQVKTLPAKFDSSNLEVEQLEATSSDGTKIPYFVVHRKDIALDGATPTILNAYGGFQVSNTPAYSATTGKLWLERGGAFVLANIRGGGEFGPAWHEAGLGVKRQIIYDDFAAVARDLIARNITSPRRLGIQGGSNGGLLMGVEMTQHPELWNAVNIQVPLLDMIRISKIAAGASWQGEYGDVNADPAVMAFWQKLSPYHALKSGVTYPEPFIFTTTRDDRVGPQHARKFAARMEELGLPFYYYENTEGGHGSGADLRQTARTNALTMTYFIKKLMD
ncbi:MAG TPA: prolyl oligopeptidase family serine peptidase [Novosphingobium sp.]|nr:prolyl oligopeptidase family serine peptidase [Novosphingobium sp.]